MMDEQSQASSRSGRAVLGVLYLVMAAFCAAGLAACITMMCLSLSTLIGLAATGTTGSIEPPDTMIALVPLSILTGVFLVIIHKVVSMKLDGFDLIAPLWFLMFGALGIVLVTSGVKSDEPGMKWTLLGLGMMFELMALPVALGWLGSFLPNPATSRIPLPGSPARAGGRVYLIIHIVALIAGVVVGRAFWYARTGV